MVDEMQHPNPTTTSLQIRCKVEIVIFARNLETYKLDICQTMAFRENSNLPSSDIVIVYFTIIETL